MARIFDSSYEQLLKDLYDAFLEACKGKRATIDESNFEGLNLMPNLMQLADDIYNQTYRPSRGIAFIITEPVPREIFAAPFRDRVVHHYLCNKSAKFLDKQFIRDSYSCRVGKGTLDAIQRMEHHIRSVSCNYQKRAFACKLDVQAYFMSMRRAALYGCMHEQLLAQFPDEKDRKLRQRLDFTWSRVILDDPTKGAKRKGKLSDWDKIPADKSLFEQEPGMGIVIGNLTSQQLSNVYLDKLDKFITMDLGYKHYGRYVDDFYLIVSEEEYKKLLEDIKMIERFLKKELGLRLHPKKRYIQEVHKGVPFMGAVIYPHCTVPGKRFVRNFYDAAYKCEIGEKEIESVISYLGYAKTLDGGALCKRIFESVGWNYKF